MPYILKTPSLPFPPGRFVEDGGPLKSVFGHDFPFWEFVQFTPVSPAQSSQGSNYAGLPYIRNTYVVFKVFGFEVYRRPVRSRNFVISLPTEVSAAIKGFYVDAGSPIESEDSFTIEYFAPVGTGVYWYTRSIAFTLDTQPAQ